jgi:hypothetical protein
MQPISAKHILALVRVATQHYLTIVFKVCFDWIRPAQAWHLRAASASYPVAAPRGMHQ